ncbi:MAG: hypothetical protein P1U56_07025 [Saprospiraceae bacterium]|nr:hypothetical protein [Saprospiraceae bacterium]
MGSNIEIHIDYLARLKSSDIDHLASVYNWEHLSLSDEGGYLWIKGLTEQEINSIEIKSIPSIEQFFTKKGKLFPLGKLLPTGNVPACLWTPIKRAIFLELPKKNHNFFEMEPSIDINIVPAEQTKQAVGHLIDWDLFVAYIKTASTLRLQPLLWTVLDGNAFVVGNPLLPLPGKTFWKHQSFLFPSGFDLELSSLTSAIQQKINPENEWDILWNVDSTYAYISKQSYEKLTRSSVALTVQSLSHQNEQS